MENLIDKVNILMEYSGNFSAPEYKTEGAAGMDLSANIGETYVLKPGERHLFPTGIKVALPIGIEAQVRSRSGLALKHGIVVLNSPGTIDADYRGEVGVILFNTGKDYFEINPGDRIAQLVLHRYVTAVPEFVVEIPKDTERGEGGFGHTGVKN